MSRFARGNSARTARTLQVLCNVQYCHAGGAGSPRAGSIPPIFLRICYALSGADMRPFTTSRRLSAQGSCSQPFEMRRKRRRRKVLTGGVESEEDTRR
eukprot:3936798-Rhodomonas_salina.1